MSIKDKNIVYGDVVIESVDKSEVDSKQNEVNKSPKENDEKPANNNGTIKKIIKG